MNIFGFRDSQESSTNGTKAQRDGLTQQHQQKKQQQKEAERQRLAAQKQAEQQAEKQRKAQEAQLAHQRKQQAMAQQEAQKQTEKMVDAQAKERQRKRQQEQARLETVVFEERQQHLKQRWADKLAAKGPDNGYSVPAHTPEDAYLRSMETPDQTRARKEAELPLKLWPDETPAQKTARLQKAKDYRAGLESAAYATDIEERLAEHEDAETIQNRRTQYLAERLNAAIKGPKDGQASPSISKAYYDDAITKIADYEIAWEDREIAKRLADWDAAQDRAEAQAMQNLSADVDQQADADPLTGGAGTDTQAGSDGADTINGDSGEGAYEAKIVDLSTEQQERIQRDIEFKDKVLPHTITENRRQQAPYDNAQINWDALEDEDEEGYEIEPHYPGNEDDVANKSGVTIGSGVDLGQHDVKELQRMGVPDEIIEKLRPGLGITGPDAYKLWKSGVIKLDESEVRLVTDLAQKHHARKIVDEFNQISADNNGQEGIQFHELSSEMQTLITSIGYQYGAQGAPTFFKHIANEDWEAAQEEMQGNNWDMRGKGKENRQNTRRQKFGEILQNENFYR